MCTTHARLSALLLIAALQSCSDPATNPPERSADAGETLAPVPGTVCSGQLPVMSVLDTDTNTEHAPDWSCYLQPSAAASPAPARAVTFSMAMSVPALVGSIDGLVADVFLGSSTLGEPAATFTFEAGKTSGTLDVPAGVSALSAHVHALAAADPRYSTADIRNYDMRIPESGVVEGTTALASQIALVANLTLGGDAPDASKATIASEVRDCRGQDVGGAVFELIDGETQKPVQLGKTGTVPREAYGQFALPNATCTFTSVGRAEWTLFNAPVNVSEDNITHPYRLRLKGRMRASDVEPVILAEETVELFPGSITTVRVYKQSEDCAVVSGALKRCD